MKTLLENKIHEMRYFLEEQYALDPCDKEFEIKVTFYKFALGTCSYVMYLICVSDFGNQDLVRK